MYQACWVAEYRPNGMLPRAQGNRAAESSDALAGPARGSGESPRANAIRRAISREPTADLLDLLPPTSPGAAAVQAALATWRSLDRQGAKIALIECDCSDDGGGRGPKFGLAVVATDPSAQVRADDFVYPGFALLTNRRATIGVVPRVWRLVCRNGAVRAVADGVHLECETRDIDMAIRNCLDADQFARTVELYRQMATRRATDPAELLRTASVSASSVPMVLQRFQGSDDQSHWGLLNAITIEAKRGATWVERLSRELDAARLAESFLDVWGRRASAD